MPSAARTLNMTKIFRIATIPLSLNILLNGQLRFLATFSDITAVSGAGFDLDKVAEREGVKIHEISIERKISIFRDLVSLIRLYRYFRKEKPDIIHSITPKAGLLSMIAGKWAGVPVRIHTFTGLIFPYRRGPMRYLLLSMDRVLCWHATHIYPEGQGVKDQLQNFRVTAKPLKVLANGNVNGIDTLHFSPDSVTAEAKQTLRDSLQIKPGDFVFLFVGRLVRDKGIRELVKAFWALEKLLIADPALTGEGSEPDDALSAQAEPRLSIRPKLILVGPLEQHLNPLRKETMALIEKNPNIITTGFQDDVRPYMAISDAFVFPSYREGFPNVVLQAGAMELPAIVTDINGSNEIVHNRQNGLVIPVKDENSLLAAMNEIVRDSDLRSVLTKNLRAEIEEKYSQQKVWEALREEYERLAP